MKTFVWRVASVKVGSFKPFSVEGMNGCFADFLKFGSVVGIVFGWGRNHIIRHCKSWLRHARTGLGGHNVLSPHSAATSA
jgi:hypothetical protein